MKQDYNDLSRYINYEDRADVRKWAWPGAVAAAWSNPGGNETFDATFGETATDETRAEIRNTLEIGLNMMAKDFYKQEYKDGTEFIDFLADPSPEDPEAPKVDVHVCFPKDRKPGEKLPVLFWVLAGGIGYNLRCFDAEPAKYAHDLHCAVVCPNYRAHPEHMFPAAINDLHATYLWILEHGEENGMDPDKIVLTGQSAGAHFSLGLAHRLKRYDVSPMPRGLVLNAPVVDDREIGTSGRYQWSDGGYTDLFRYQICWESYVGYGNVGNSALTPEAWPNHATLDDVRGLPPMCIHANESDPNRDATIQYAQKLLDVGVFCGLHVWPATQHGFLMTLILMDSPDPYAQRFMREYYSDIQGFWDYDFRRLPDSVIDPTAEYDDGPNEGVIAQMRRAQEENEE